MQIRKLQSVLFVWTLVADDATNNKAICQFYSNVFLWIGLTKRKKKPRTIYAGICIQHFHIHICILYTESNILYFRINKWRFFFSWVFGQIWNQKTDRKIWFMYNRCIRILFYTNFFTLHMNMNMNIEYISLPPTIDLYLITL